MQRQARNKPQVFAPSALQVRYRQARAEALCAGRTFTDAALAAHIGCRAATVSTWKRDAAFRDWLDADAREAVAHLWHPILLRAAQLAAEGSVEHMKFIAPFMADRSDGQERGCAAVGVLVVKPRPTANRPGDVGSAPFSGPRR
jgi:hypothetical protein